MLNNEFFKIQNKTISDQDIIFDIQLNKDHKVYKGHFPSQAVAPGVCLAQTVKELCEMHLEKDLKMVSSRNMKFMAVLDPNENENVSVKILIKEVDENYSIRANCFNEKTSFFKIDATYK